MITFNVEYQQQVIMPGDEVKGFLVMQLSTPSHLSAICLNVACEVVTRRMENGETRKIKTDRKFLLYSTIKLFNSSITGGELFSPDTYRYLFKLHIPMDFPGSLRGPDLGWIWCQKQKYEINYWLEVDVTDKMIQKQKFQFEVYERPDMRNFPTFFQQSPVERTGSTEVSQGCWDEPGKVDFKFNTVCLYKIAGECFSFTLSLENHLKKPITKVFVLLNQIVNYTVTSHEKYKVLEIGKECYDTNIGTNDCESMVMELKIPAVMPASTPSVYNRKIKILYEIAVQIFVSKNAHELISLFSQKILVSSLSLQ